MSVTAHSTAERPAEFDAKVMAHVKALGRLAWRKTHNRDAANDLVSDTVILALHRWQNYNPKWAMWTWLGMLMKGKARDNWVAKNRRIALVGEGNEYQNAQIDGGQLNGLELADVLRRAKKVPNSDVPIRLAYGDSVEQIAAERGVTKGSIMATARHASRQIRDLCK